MIRNFLLISALFSCLVITSTQASAADRDQIRAEQCVLNANYLITDPAAEIDSAELDKNIRCAFRLLETKAKIEQRKKSSNKNANKNKGNKGKGNKNKNGKGKGGNTGKGDKNKGGKDKGGKNDNKNKGDDKGKGGKGGSKNNKPTCAETLEENKAQRAVIVKKRDDCVAAADLVTHYAIKIELKDECEQDFYTEINKLPYIVCGSNGETIIHHFNQ